MIEKNMESKRFIKTFSSRILSKLLISMVVYTISFLIFIFLCKLVGMQFVWRGDELFYSTLHFINNNMYFIIIISLLVGYGAISIKYWIMMLEYFQNLTDATENIYNSNENWLTLPADLGEIENKINQIKQKVKEDRLIVKEAEQRKNDLVVYLAHDLKTPLTSIIGYLTLLRDEKRISRELREKYLSIALEKSERLEDLINEFFEITRFNLSNITLDYNKVNLKLMLQQLVFEFKPMLNDKKLKCILNMKKDIMIKCDINKLQRVFDNVLRNAVNYSFENTTIRINVTDVSSNINISFINRGFTIPKEKLERIFEQFYRLDTSRTTNNGGAGLGLAIAKQIIELHKGTITANSNDDKIEFIITIPKL